MPPSAWGERLLNTVASLRRRVPGGARSLATLPPLLPGVASYPWRPGQLSATSIPAMSSRGRKRAFGLLGAALLVGAASRALSPSARASFLAAYRAYRDPSLLDVRPTPPPEVVSCQRFRDEKAVPEPDLAQAFERPSHDDLDDPEGATLATLTMPDLHVPITRQTMRFVRFFAQNEAGRKVFLARYRRAGLFRESIAYALREAGLPEDLMWLAAIESGFDPRAVSPAGASGLWQFMPETGQVYGLTQSSWVDERRNIARSTTAAVAHLRDLYERFGRWDLALAAYNAGYDRVVAAMEKVARSRGPAHLDDPPIEFSDVAAARALPAETANYVPQIMAFALVAANRTRFALDLPDLSSPLEFGELAVPEGTRLRTVARAAGVSIAVLRDYNPQLLRDRVPPVGGDYIVLVPESRVQRALAAFPAYADQEVLAQNDPGDDRALDDPANTIAAGFAVDASGDEPLPRRPIPLGKNRLPELAIPGRERVIVSAAGFGVGILEAKLPAALMTPNLGWSRPFLSDPMGVFGADYRGGSAGAKGREAAIDKQLGFLDQIPTSMETLRSFSLPSGVTVRVRRDRRAPTTAITVRIATAEEPGEARSKTPLGPNGRGAEAAASEALYTITVENGDAEAGIELASTRLRLLLGDTAGAQLAEIRGRAGSARRRALQKTPYGSSWIALSEALFPQDHPLAGTLLGASEDVGALREMMTAEAMRREHALARASITVVGDVDELRAKKLCEAALGSLTVQMDTPVGPHPRDDRLTVEEAVTSPRVLVGWIGPGEGEVGDASLRVAFEILENPKLARLSHVVANDGVISMAHAALEIGPRASIAAIELAPAPLHDVGEALSKLDAAIARMATEGPTGNDVATAKFILLTRMQKEFSSAASGSVSSVVHSASILRLRHALRPWAAERARKALDEVTISSVRSVLQRVLTDQHRVVVTTVPRG